MEEEVVMKDFSDFNPRWKGLPNIPSGSGIKRGDVLCWVKNKEKPLTFIVTKVKKKKKR